MEQGILAEKSQDWKSDMILSAAVDRQLRKMRIALKKKRDSLKIEKQYLYEQYKRDQIERETYLHRVKALREEENRLSEQIQKLQEEREHCGQNDNSQQEQTGKLESLTREVVDEWIDRIYVYGESRIDIVYKEKIKKSKKSIKNC